jgi:hypothetical protein
MKHIELGDGNSIFLSETGNVTYAFDVITTDCWVTIKFNLTSGVYNEDAYNVNVLDDFDKNKPKKHPCHPPVFNNIWYNIKTVKHMGVFMTGYFIEKGYVKVIGEI